MGANSSTVPTNFCSYGANQTNYGFFWVEKCSKFYISQNRKIKPWSYNGSKFTFTLTLVGDLNKGHWVHRNLQDFCIGRYVYQACMKSHEAIQKKSSRTPQRCGCSIFGNVPCHFSSCLACILDYHPFIFSLSYQKNQKIIFASVNQIANSLKKNSMLIFNQHRV